MGPKIDSVGQEWKLSDFPPEKLHLTIMHKFTLKQPLHRSLIFLKLQNLISIPTAVHQEGILEYLLPRIIDSVTLIVVCRI